MDSWFRLTARQLGPRSEPLAERALARDFLTATPRASSATPPSLRFVIVTGRTTASTSQGRSEDSAWEMHGGTRHHTRHTASVTKYSMLLIFSL